MCKTHSVVTYVRLIGSVRSIGAVFVQQPILPGLHERVIISMFNTIVGLKMAVVTSGR